MDNELPLEAEREGDAYTRQAARAADAARRGDAVDGSEVARTAFGEEVVDHYVNAGRVELAAFDSAVTDWERVRGFERL